MDGSTALYAKLVDAKGEGANEALDSTASKVRLKPSYLKQLMTLLLPDSLLVAVTVYTLTGVLAPTLIDYLYHNYDIDQFALFPVLSTAVGLTLVMPLSRMLFYDIHVPWASEPANAKGSLPIASLDLLATSLVTVGLVNVGSATYTVIYSSAAAWTALMSWRSGMKLKRFQVLGVALVTLGLLINGIGHVYEDETRSETGFIIFIGSCLALLIGTVLHSLVMVRIDQVTKESQSKALQMASNMGRWEVGFLLMWNLARGLWVGSGTTVSSSSGSLSLVSALIWFCLLSFNQSLHSLAFFSMIGRLGAVGSAVLKGFLALNTFGLAAVLFCNASNTKSCLTPLKTLSMLLVVMGGFIYGVSTSKSKQKDPKSESEVNKADMMV